MRAVSRLSTNSLAGRRSRTALLIVAVALSTALVAAIACGLASLNAGMEYRIASTIGEADVQVRHVLAERIPDGLLEEVRGWDGVKLATGRTREAMRVRAADGGGEPVLLSAQGIDPSIAYRLTVVSVDEGRRVEHDGEILLGREVATKLGVGVGDEVLAGDGDRARPLRVVGVAGKKVIEMVNRPSALVTLQTLRDVTGITGRLREITIVLENGVDPDRFVAAHSETMPSSIEVRATERVTSGISRLVRANRFLFLVSSIISYLASAAIVLVGLTTSVVERQRELALLRCIGATRVQLGATQLFVGGLVGLVGALIGTPLGIFLAWLLTVLFPERLPAGLSIWPTGLLIAAGGAICAGLAGALWPAWNASHSRPLAAMVARARPVRPWAIVIAGLVGLALLMVQIVVMLLTRSGPGAFWGYAIVGAPAMFVGYFLLGVPIVWLIARGIGPWLGRALGLPRMLLGNNVSSTPMRSGFTAGALMVGLATMTTVYTNGNGLMRDWIDSIRFPDAFVNGLLIGLTPEAQRTIDALDIVDHTCAVSVFKAEAAESGGLFSLGSRPKAYFIAFEPEPFFAMTNLYWMLGDEATAKKRLEEGGAVIVSIGFWRAHPGLELGNIVEIDHQGRRIGFELVGVVSSPGLDLVRKHFEFEEEFAEFATTSVFGTRADLKKFFGTDAISLIQIGLKKGVDDDEAVRRIEAALDQPGYVVGSGRQIKESLNAFGRSIMRIASVIAIGAMLIGCAGVASVVIAGVDARRFEFGVLRSVGAERGMLARLVVGEVLVIALGACVLGTALGLQSAWASMRVYGLLTSVRLRPHPPWALIGLGWVILLALVLGSVAPVVWRLLRMSTRELLASTRG